MHAIVNKFLQIDVFNVIYMPKSDREYVLCVCVCVCFRLVPNKLVCILSLGKWSTFGLLTTSFVWVPSSFTLVYYGPLLPLYTSARLNLRDRFLNEVKKNSFIALSGKEGHSEIMPSKLCVPSWRVNTVQGVGCDQLMDILLIPWLVMR